MNITRRHLLHSLARCRRRLGIRPGRLRRRMHPTTRSTDHWWGMLIDITKCIGCGSCVRACPMENNVPDGYFRTWVERYSGGRLEDRAHPTSIHPMAANNGFPPPYRITQRQESSLSPSSATTAPIPLALRSVPWARPSHTAGRRRPGRQNYCLGCRYCVQACPYGCRYIHPKTNTSRRNALSAITASPRA